MRSSKRWTRRPTTARIAPSSCASTRTLFRSSVPAACWPPPPIGACLTWVRPKGLVLKDLIFANDGNPKILPNGLVNFGKLRTLAQLVERLALFQSNPYTIQREDAVHEYCSRLIALSEERLYKYSLLCEPRATNEQQPVRLVDKWNAENIGFIEKWVRDL
eukprot:Unigene6013_Nuclearia_a/m.18429 Unigene6013_Nuclearia_a/g.18429  ORF Unigene6013_Nuclearia_a/g.18429 Unigene6013_Nuclearia_a/m.18429 type:complete len:161 (+) Unigene6013_Nuclearia_a:1722-2204(+)